MFRSILRLILALPVLLLACSGSDTSTGADPASSWTRITVVGPSQVLAGSTHEYSARAIDGNGSPHTVRGIEWSVVPSDLATIDASGRLTAHGPGTLQVRARLDGITGAQGVLVLSPLSEIVLSPTLLPLEPGEEKGLSATLLDIRGEPIQPDSGLVWRASGGGVRLFGGQTRGLDPRLGLVLGISPGVVTVTASYGEITSAPAQVVVGLGPPDSIDLNDVRLNLGESRELAPAVYDVAGRHLSGAPVVFVVGDTSIARVIDRSVTGLAKGITTLTAHSGEAARAVQISVVGPPASDVDILLGDPLIEIGHPQPVSVTARTADGEVISNPAVIWSTSDPAVAQVSQDGLISGVSAGSAVIRARVDEVVDSVTVLVDRAVVGILLDRELLGLAPGASVSVTAQPIDASGAPLSGRTLGWMIEGNSGVATVISPGRILTTGPGEAVLAVSYRNVVVRQPIQVIASPVTSVEIVPSTVSLKAGSSVQLAARVLTPGGEVSGRLTTWRTADASVAVVDGNGVLTGITPGSTTVSVEVEGVSASAGVSVEPEREIAGLGFWTLLPFHMRMDQEGSGAVFALDARGDVVPVPGGWQLSISDSSVARLSFDTSAPRSVGIRLKPLRKGTGWLHARLGQFVDSVPYAVIEEQPIDTRIWHPEFDVSILPGETRFLKFEALDPSAKMIPDPIPFWQIARNAGITIDPLTGVATGVTPGDNQVLAHYGGHSASTNVYVENPAVGIRFEHDTVGVRWSRRVHHEKWDRNGNSVWRRPMTAVSADSSIVIPVFHLPYWDLLPQSPGTTTVTFFVDGISTSMVVVVLPVDEEAPVPEGALYPVGDGPGMREPDRR